MLSGFEGVRGLRSREPHGRLLSENAIMAVAVRFVGDLRGAALRGSTLAPVGRGDVLPVPAHAVRVLYAPKLHAVVERNALVCLLHHHRAHGPLSLASRNPSVRADDRPGADSGL